MTCTTILWLLAVAVAVCFVAFALLGIVVAVESQLDDRERARRNVFPWRDVCPDCAARNRTWRGPTSTGGAA